MAHSAAGADQPRRLFVYNGGFLTQRRIRRILDLAGWQIRLGGPGTDDWVGVWGKSPTSPRGEKVAKRSKAPVLRVEDAFLRSLHPGRSGAQPLGLLLDQSGVHFDSATPSDLETLLATAPLDDTALLNRARDATERLKSAHLSKYNAFDPALSVPEAPYVLVIDQTRGDASITHAGASAASFREMLVFAQEENPGSRVVIKSHPESVAGYRAGHFGPEDETHNISLIRDPVSPWALMEGAIGVYTISSGLGFEAILAGHNPRVFGQPWYGGWGLTRDENPVPRRTRTLTRAQMFAAAMILYPTWYDPYRDQLCQLETVIDTLEAQARAWRADRHGYVATGMRLWKRKTLSQIYGREKPVIFHADTDKAVERARQTGRHLMVWAGKEQPEHANPDLPLVRVEDGFLRSRGLGAALTPPLSLVSDDLGIYYDPHRESRLERLIAASTALPDPALRRARRLIATLIETRLSKYNLTPRPLPDLPTGTRILVPGQVEDDASILHGCGAVASNLALLEATRAQNPDAVIVYKPHPDVEAGLRAGSVDPGVARTLADVIADDADPIALIEAVDAVWTMTSLIGFEALLRGKAVTTLGVPFYAGWGLSEDLGDIPDRRRARPDLAALVHATLIDYPRYHDPISGLPCPVEVAVDRLSDPALSGPGRFNRGLSKLQGMFVSYAHLWR